MEDQGIMALPQGQAMQAPTARPAAPQTTPDAMAAFEAARMQIDPVEFNDEMLSQAEKADPETVSQFRQILDENELPPEVIDALGQMVDILMAEPAKYKENRAKFIEAGVPEDFLPEEFDAAFFGALNMALDQLNSDISPKPQAFAMGGEVKMTPLASGIAQLGRRGDTQLAHINRSEARMLRRAGGSGTINPMTGMPEYFIGKIFKSVGNAFKKIGKSVSNAVRGVVNGVKNFAKSTVGRIVTTVALGFFLGPAAAGLLGVSSAAGVAAIGGFVGGFGSSLLAGDNVRTALKNGAIGGLTAGAASAVSGGAAAFQSAAPGTPVPSFTESVGQQWDKFTKGVGSLMAPEMPPTGAAPSGPALSAEAAPAPMPQGPTPAAAPTPSAGLPPAIEPPPFMASNAPGVDMAALPGGTATDVTAGTLKPSVYQQTPADFARSLEPRVMGPQMPTEFSATPGTGISAPGQPPNFLERAYQGVKDFYSPQASLADINAAYQKELANRAALGMDISLPSVQEAAYKMAEKSTTPLLGTTSRVIGTGIGVLGLTGGFTPKDPGRPGILPTETGEDLLRKDPAKYGVTPGGGRIIYGGYPALGTPPGGYAQGGIASLEEKYPRKTGPINGPGTGTSDSIPAMLSDGEFVFTAKAVRAMGNGSRRKGAKRMYALMKKLEGAR